MNRHAVGVAFRRRLAQHRQSRWKRGRGLPGADATPFANVNRYAWSPQRPADGPLPPPLVGEPAETVAALRSVEDADAALDALKAPPVDPRMERLESRVLSGARTTEAEKKKAAADEARDAVLSGPASFAPEVRRQQLLALSAATTLTRLHDLPEVSSLEATRARDLCGDLWPWEWEHAEPPIPNEYWSMSQAERRFLGLPWRDESAAETGADPPWRPPSTGFTEQQADLAAFDQAQRSTDKVRRGSGDKRLLTRDEVATLREAEDSLSGHLRARLEDMAPYLRERGAAWQRRREERGRAAADDEWAKQAPSERPDDR